jgi:hypothetical protein
MGVDDNYSQRLNALLARMNLERLTWADRPIPSDPALALEQLISRSIRLYGVVLDEFIRAYFKEFPPEFEMDDEEIETHMKQVMREKVASITRFLIRKHLKNEGAQSLAIAAAQVYDPKASSFSKSKSELIKSVEDAVTFLGIWNVEKEFREVDGKEVISRYNLSAGHVLVAFHENIYVPYFAAAVQKTQPALATLLDGAK